MNYIGITRYLLSQKYLNCIPSRDSRSILVIENSSHTNARGLPTLRKHMTIRNDVQDVFIEMIVLKHVLC